MKFAKIALLLMIVVPISFYTLSQASEKPESKVPYQEFRKLQQYISASDLETFKPKFESFQNKEQYEEKKIQEGLRKWVASKMFPSFPQTQQEYTEAEAINQLQKQASSKIDQLQEDLDGWQSKTWDKIKTGTPYLLAGAIFGSLLWKYYDGNIANYDSVHLQSTALHLISTVPIPPINFTCLGPIAPVILASASGYSFYHGAKNIREGVYFRYNTGKKLNDAQQIAKLFKKFNQSNKQ